VAAASDPAHGEPGAWGQCEGICALCRMSQLGAGTDGITIGRWSGPGDDLDGDGTITFTMDAKVTS